MISAEIVDIVTVLLLQVFLCLNLGFKSEDFNCLDQRFRLASA